MRIAIVSPHQSINASMAMYSGNLKKALASLGHQCIVYEMMDKEHRVGNHYFNTYSLQAYRDLATVINGQSDCCVLNYHPDVYGTKDGRQLQVLAKHLKVPLVTVCHFLNNAPSANEKQVLAVLADGSFKLVTFSQIGMDFLEHFYKLNSEKLLKIEPGVVQLDSDKALSVRAKLKLEQGKLMLSTGLLTREKGYETVINALPSVLNYYPDLVYLIVGETDPGELLARGESYRKQLMMMAAKRGVADKVIFIKSLESEQDVVNLAREADLFVAPNLEEKSVSNSCLTMALGAGAVVLSTPTWFAKEVLDDQRGQLFPFKNSKELSQTIINTLRNPREMELYRGSASLFGSQFTWTKTAKRFASVLSKAHELPTVKKASSEIIKTGFLPEWKAGHLNRLLVGPGVLSQALYNVVDYQQGYLLKDNALALQVCAMANDNEMCEGVYDHMRTLLSFIAYMQEGFEWRKGMAFDHRKDAKQDQLAIGLTIASLGYFYHSTKSQSLKDVAYDLIEGMLLKGHELTQINAMAAAIVGGSYVLEADKSNPDVTDRVRKYANQIYKLIPDDQFARWVWFEEPVTDYHGLVPLSMAHAYIALGDKKYLSASRRTCRFIEKLLFSDMHFNPAIGGASSLSAKNGRSNEQYAPEACWMNRAYYQLFKLTKEPIYLTQMSKVHLWYLGDNSLSKPLYDHAEGGCYNGLSYKGVMAEKGAEATCSYWISHFTLLDAYYDEMALEQ